MLQDSDLTPLERALCSAAAAGRLLDSRCRRSDEDDPVRGRTWGKDRQVRAQVLSQLLTGEGCLDQVFGKPLAVRLRGVKVSGRLNLGGRTVRCPLELYGCYLGGRLDMAKAEASDVSLRGSHLAQRLSARGLRLTGGLNLTSGFRCHGTVDLRGGHVGGQLNCAGAALGHPGGRALTADGLTADQGLSLRSADVTGEVRLLGARVGGLLDCREATLSNPGGPALTALVLTVELGLSLRSAVVTGEVRLLGARVGGLLDCREATLSNPGGSALTALVLTVELGMSLSSAVVTGEVRLAGAHIGGLLYCEKATLSNPGRQVLIADGLSVEGDMFLNSAKVTGEVSLHDAHIGRLYCDGTTLSNPGGQALTAIGMTVDQGLSLRSAEVTGEVSLLGAHVDLLSCEGATLSNPGGWALIADRLTVNGDLFLRSAEVTGEVRLLGARAGGNLDCEGATLSNPGGRVLNLESALITGAVTIYPARLEGSIDLRAARVGGWYDSKRTWPTTLNLEGFVYDAIGPAGAPRQRLGWLRLHQDGYLPQPYEQLASVYRRAGNDQAARTVAIAKQQARRAHAGRWVRVPSRAWSFVLRWTIGYGYRPALALPYLAGLFVIGWVVFGHAYPAELRPAKSGPGQPGFNPARYTLDLLLPVANLHQREAFVPHGYAAWWAFGLTLAGWLLAAVVVVGLTGVFKRD